MNVKILDCTLRDGGYINNWEFGIHNVKSIISKLSFANIDIIEIGFMTEHSKGEDYSLYTSCEEIYKLLPAKAGFSKIAAMIALGEKEINPDKLPDAKNTVLDIIRLTFHNESKEIQRAFSYAQCLMDKGYLVCMQPVGTTAYTDIELIHLIEKINELRPFAFYLVDTLGILNKHDLLHFLYLIDNNLSKEIKIGFHSHNNLQMSFANAQEIIEFSSSREFILDSSVFGMGRGAGNLCTEIVTDFINKTVEKRYDTIPLLEIIDESLMPIYSRTPWGYSAAYFLSASCKCHPNYSSYLLSKQTLHATTISAILDRIPNAERPIFNEELIESLYLAFQEEYVDDADVLDKLKSEISGRKILLIAPGKSIISDASKIQQFILKENPYVFAINFVPDFEYDKIFVSNQRRFSALGEVDTKKILFTSNVKERPRCACVVNYTNYLNHNKLIYDNSGLMLIKLLIDAKADSIYLAGFDGFARNSIDNYASPSHTGVSEWEQMEQVNHGVAFQMKKYSESIPITFITNTRYEL